MEGALEDHFSLFTSAKQTSKCLWLHSKKAGDFYALSTVGAMRNEAEQLFAMPESDRRCSQKFVREAQK